MNERQIGRVHRALRRRLGLTQAELSRRAGVQRNKISELECFDLSRMTEVVAIRPDVPDVRQDAGHAHQRGVGDEGEDGHAGALP